MDITKVMQTREFAKEKHASVNHMYGEYPYILHLDWAYNVGRDFIHWIPEDFQERVLSAIYAHDLLEDTRMTYNDLKEFFESLYPKGYSLPLEIVYAVTNEKGKNRAERANDKYYEGIVKTPYASFVKAIDRLANTQFSANFRGKMLSKYRNEMPDFLKKLNLEKDYPEIAEHLMNL